MARDREAKREHSRKDGMTGGFIMLGLGVLFLLINFGYLRWDSAWPLILVVVGLALVFGAFRHHEHKASQTDQPPTA